MSEKSDAVVIIVSEETGIISIAVDGNLKRGFTEKSFVEYMRGILVNEESSKKGGIENKHGNK